MSMHLYVYVGPFAKCDCDVTEMSWGDIDAIIGGELSHNNEGDIWDIWKPNMTGWSGGGTTFGPHEGNKLTPIVPLEVPPEIIGFENAYRKAIGKLKEIYGADHVKIVWGVVPYYS